MFVIVCGGYATLSEKRSFLIFGMTFLTMDGCLCSEDQRVNKCLTVCCKRFCRAPSKVVTSLLNSYRKY